MIQVQVQIEHAVDLRANLYYYCRKAGMHYFYEIVERTDTHLYVTLDGYDLEDEPYLIAACKEVPTTIVN